MPACLVAFVLALSVAGHSSASEFNLDSLLAASVGGPSARDRLEAAAAYYSRGEVSIYGTVGSFEEYYAFPDRYYLRLSFPDYSIVQAFDGQVAWTQDHNGHVAELTGREKQELMNGLYLGTFSYLFRDRLPGRVEYLGRAEFEGAMYHRVAFHPFDRDTVYGYFSVADGLLVVASSRNDNLTSLARTDSHRWVEGILWPAASRVEVEGTELDMAFEYRTIALNPPVDPTMFRKPELVSRDFRLPEGADSVVVPFDYRGGHIRLQVVVNGLKKGWVLLDSGSSGNVYDASFLADLTTDTVGHMAVIELSEVGGAALVRVDSLLVGDLTMFGQIAGVQDMSELRAAGSQGLPFAGIIGYDFLSRFPLLIDYERRTLTVYRPESYRLPDSAVVLEFDLTMRIPTVRAELNGIPGDFIVDLGNPFGLMLHESFVTRHGLVDKLDDVRDDAFTISGVTGSVPSRSAYAATFRLGGVALQSLRVLLPDASQGLTGTEDLAGNIGNLVLEQFRVLFDYRAGVLALYPADNRG